MILIDVRSEKEFNEGHLENAMNIPVQIIVKAMIPVNKDGDIQLYCLSGNRAKMAQLILKHRGFTNVKLLNETGVMN